MTPKLFLALMAVAAFIVSLCAVISGRWDVATYALIWAVFWDLRFLIKFGDD